MLRCTTGSDNLIKVVDVWAEGPQGRKCFTGTPLRLITTTIGKVFRVTIL